MLRYILIYVFCQTYSQMSFFLSQCSGKVLYHVYAQVRHFVRYKLKYDGFLRMDLRYVLR